MPIHSAVSCNLDSEQLRTCLPLLEAGEVDALEWSFDTVGSFDAMPDWFAGLLHEFGAAQRLIGHGVFFSILSGKWSQEQQKWLDDLRSCTQVFDFQHITEHFGFFTGPDFHKGAPISAPFTASTLRIGRDRLMRMHDACGVAVGIENLAVAYSLDEVRRHGAFLDALVEPLNGFIILDLHNLYCQMHNFDLAFEQLVELYPLHRVREIHVSGGSWEPLKSNLDRLARRDTHDDAVPDTVFEMLAAALPMCPNLQFVVMEQLGFALHSAEQQAQFQADFRKMRAIVQAFQASTEPKASFLPTAPLVLETVIPEDLSLHADQLALSHILETGTDYKDVMEQLAISRLAQSDWQTERWAPEMVETCMQIAQKWKK